jgi:anti-sigma regulatory factor (Ser/Thr protein kinase)
MAVDLVLSLPAELGAAGAAREELERMPGIDQYTRERLALLVSELVSNAVQHASGPIELSVTRGEPLRVEVADGGPGFDPARITRRRDGGYGLVILEQLAARWGVVPGPPSRVWFEL